MNSHCWTSMSILILINVSRTPFQVLLLMREFKKRPIVQGICTGGILSIVAIFYDSHFTLFQETLFCLPFFGMIFCVFWIWFSENFLGLIFCTFWMRFFRYLGPDFLWSLGSDFLGAFWTQISEYFWSKLFGQKLDFKHSVDYSDKGL